MVILLGVLYGLLLVSWIVSALPALLAFVPGNLPGAAVPGWLVSIGGWLAVPVACLLALPALFAGELDGRSLLPPLAIGVLFLGFGLGAGSVTLAEAIARRRRARRPVPLPDPFGTGVPDAPEGSVPEPWHAHGPLGISGIRGLGFAAEPGTGRELMLVLTFLGSGLFDVVSGERVARDEDPAVTESYLAAVAGQPVPVAREHRCPGLGPLVGHAVPMVGFGAVEPASEAEAWNLAVVEHGDRARIVLSHAASWWVVAEVAAPVDVAGFSPSGATVVVVSDSGLWWCARAVPGSG